MSKKGVFIFYWWISGGNLTWFYVLMGSYQHRNSNRFFYWEVCNTDQANLFVWISIWNAQRTENFRIYQLVTWLWINSAASADSTGLCPKKKKIHLIYSMQSSLHKFFLPMISKSNCPQIQSSIRYWGEHLTYCCACKLAAIKAAKTAEDATLSVACHTWHETSYCSLSK